MIPINLCYRIAGAVAGLVILVTAPQLPAQVSLSEAVDTPGLVWNTSAENPFVGILSAEARQDGDLARGAIFPNGNIAFEGENEIWMETTVEGPGVFQVWVKSTGDPYLTAGLQVDGIEVDWWRLEYEWGPPSPWRAYSAAIRPGAHTVRVWGCFACDEIGTLPLDNPTIDVDQAELLPLDPSLGEAMDAPGQPWYAGGQIAVVFGQDAHDSTDAVRSDLTEGISWLETVVEGPATASWWRKGRARIRIDGLSVNDDLEVAWIRDTYFVPPGQKVIRWSDDEQGPGGERSTLDQFSSISAPEISLAEALDSGAQVLTQGGGGVWRGVASEAAPDGEDMAWLEVRSENDPAWLETVVEGPAALEYELLVRGDVSLTVTANGQQIDYGSRYVYGEVPDTHHSILPPGTHRIRWEVRQDRFPFSEKGLLMLDQLTITPLQGTSLVEAFDDPNLAWTTGGDRPWSGVLSALAPDGNDAAVSPELTEGQSSWLETTVTGPGTFSFDWMPGYEPQAIRRWEFLVNGEPLTWAADYSLRLVRSRFLELGAGEHILRWQLAGAVSGSVLVLDRVNWIPSAQPLVSRVLDLPPSTIYWQNANWSALSGAGQGGGDGLQFGPVGTFSSLTQLTLRVQGPAQLTFLAKTGEHCGLRYQTNGVASEVVSTEGAWQVISLQVPPGDRELHLIPQGWNSFPTLANSVWLDQFTLSSNEASIASVLAPFAPGLQWSTNPQNAWRGVARAGYSSVVAAGRSVTDELSWLETEVQGPAVIKFLARGQGQFTSPNFPGIRILVDGQESATVSSAQHKWVLMYLPTGEHTLRFEAAQGVQITSPEMQRFTVSLMSGEPTIKLVDGFLELTVPRPSGFTDDKIGMNVSESLFYLKNLSAKVNPPPLHQSTPTFLIFRYDLTRRGFPERLFGSARFDP